jgi:proteasome lid subunit RPN8/RPN11
VTGAERVGLEISWLNLTRLIAELARRGAGQREAGAFLLAPRETVGTAAQGARPRVAAVAYYDDLDPKSLTGGITFGAAGYSALNAYCRAHRMRVVGDIHTHPGSWVGQSAIDAAHPMSAVKGHVAIIAPNYGRGRIRFSDLGIHVFNAPGWTSHFHHDVQSIIATTGSATIARIVTKLRTVADMTYTVLRKWSAR